MADTRSLDDEELLDAVEQAIQRRFSTDIGFISRVGRALVIDWADGTSTRLVIEGA